MAAADSDTGQFDASLIEDALAANRDALYDVALAAARPVDDGISDNRRVLGKVVRAAKRPVMAGIRENNGILAGIVGPLANHVESALAENAGLLATVEGASAPGMVPNPCPGNPPYPAPPGCNWSCTRDGWLLIDDVTGEPCGEVITPIGNGANGAAGLSGPCDLGGTGPGGWTRLPVQVSPGFWHITAWSWICSTCELRHLAQTLAPNPLAGHPAYLMWLGDYWRLGAGTFSQAGSAIELEVFRAGNFPLPAPPDWRERRFVVVGFTYDDINALYRLSRDIDCATVAMPPANGNGRNGAVGENGFKPPPPPSVPASGCLCIDVRLPREALDALKWLTACLKRFCASDRPADEPADLAGCTPLMGD